MGHFHKAWDSFRPARSCRRGLRPAQGNGDLRFREPGLLDRVGLPDWVNNLARKLAVVPEEKTGRTSYRQRNRIQRVIVHLKINRAIATRYN